MVGLALAAGCGGRGEEYVKAAPSERLLRICNWEGYIDPSLLDDFSKRTGIRVEYHELATQDDLTGSLHSDPARYDVVMIDESVIRSLRELRLLRPFDVARLPNLSLIDARYLAASGGEGERYAVPYFWGSTLLAYRKDKVKDVPHSWAALWDARHAGRVMMLPDAQELFGITSLLLGFPMNSRAAAHLEAACAKLVEQAPLVLEYADALRIQRALVKGDSWLACLYSGDAVKAARENPNIGYVIPDEGAPLWIDCFALPRDAEHVEEAHEFVAYMLEPSVAARNANHLYFATPNMQAITLMAGELRRDHALFPAPDVLARCAFFIKPDTSLQRYYNETRQKIRQVRGNGGSE